MKFLIRNIDTQVIPLIENYINYSGTFGKHNIDAVLGQTYQSEYYHSLRGTGNNLSEPYYLQLDNASERNSYSYESDWMIASYIGRFNYNYDGKYFFSATARRDGASHLSPEDRFDIFPSVSAGWRIERESFFPVDPSTISLFKIRGSYGELGSIENLGVY